jgi:hypothetical protein
MNLTPKVKRGLLALAAGAGLLFSAYICENWTRGGSNYAGYLALIGVIVFIGAFIFLYIVGIDQERQYKTEDGTKEWLERQSSTAIVTSSTRTGFCCPECASDQQKDIDLPFKIIGRDILKCGQCEAVWATAEKGRRWMSYFFIALGAIFLFIGIGLIVDNPTDHPSSDEALKVFFNLGAFIFIPLWYGIRGITRKRGAQILVRGKSERLTKLPEPAEQPPSDILIGTAGQPIYIQAEQMLSEHEQLLAVARALDLKVSPKLPKSRF